MKKKLTLNIADPCHENWDGMTNAPDGRFCRSCSRVVVDFTTMTDREILKFFKEYKGKVCGNFNPYQLGRPIVKEPFMPRALRSRAAAALVAGTIMATSDLNGQQNLPIGKSTIPHTVMTDESREIGDKAKNPAETRTINGILKCAQSGEPILFGNLHIIGTRRGTATDLDGKFELKVSPGDTIVASYIGYESIKINVDTIDSEPLVIEMEMGKVLVGEVVIVDYHLASLRGVVTGVVSVITDESDEENDAEVPDEAEAATPDIMSIAPNPFHDRFKVTLDIDAPAKYELFVFSIDGKMVWKDKKKLHQGRHVVPVQFGKGLPDGEYVVHVRWNGGQANEIVVKQ